MNGVGHRVSARNQALGTGCLPALGKKLRMQKVEEVTAHQLLAAQLRPPAACEQILLVPAPSLL
jgi:hypothetical protein